MFSYIESLLFERQVHLSCQAHSADGILDDLQVGFSFGLHVTVWALVLMNRGGGGG
jgi:hypothetical protein